ncbi:acyl carrier protein [Streptomyces albus]|nr:acyl carrier protein [Streptomyces albus]
MPRRPVPPSSTPTGSASLPTSPRHPGVSPAARLFDGVPAFRDALRGVGALHEEPSTEDPDAFLRRLGTLPARQRSAEMLRLVRTQAALVLGHDSDDAVAPDRGFVDLGFDSLTATRLRHRLGAATALQISAATVLGCPTPGSLADHLLELCTAPRTRTRPRLRPRNRE